MLSSLRTVPYWDGEHTPSPLRQAPVVPLINEVFGAMAPVTVKFLHKVAERTRGRQLAEHDDPLAPWSAPTLAPYLSQSVSIALQRGVADQVLKLAADARADPFRA